MDRLIASLKDVCTLIILKPPRDDLVVSESASHAVGRGFAPWPGHTNDHHNKSAKWHCGHRTPIFNK